ncbi:reverse transcriptase domain-containing protein [Tanacetum coccineum]
MNINLYVLVHQFTRDNDVSVGFDAYGFSIKDYQIGQLLLRCDSTGDLYPVTHQPSSQTLVVLLSFSSTTWHKRLGHPRDDVLRRLESRNLISCRKSKLSALCHACQLGKHVKLPFYNFESFVDSVFEIIHSNIWTLPIPSESGIKYYVIFLDHFLHFVWVYPLHKKSDLFDNFVAFRAYVNKQFNVDIKALQCDHGGEYDNTRFHDLFRQNGIQFRFSFPRTSQQNGKSELIMSSATSAVTYTSVYTDFEPGRAFWGADDEEVSEGGIPRDEDEHEFSAEEQPLPLVDSPTAESPNMLLSRIRGGSKEYADDETEDTSISLPPEAEVERLLTITTLSPSPPSAGERLARCMALPAHSPPLLPSSGCPTQIQTLRIASTQALIDAVTAALPSPPLPPSLYIPPPVDRRDDIPESEQPPRKRLYLSTLGSRYEVGESSTARPTRGQGIDYGFVSTVDAEERRQGIRGVGYGIRGTWVDLAEAVPEIAPMTVREVNTRVIELAELHEHDTQDLYALLEDAQDIWMVEEEAYAFRELGHSIRLSQTTHQELQTHRDHVYAHETHLQAHQTELQLQSTLIQTQHQVHETHFQMQQAELAALRETDRRRQDQMVETLRVIRDIRREISDMQAKLLTLQEQQRRARQPGQRTRITDHQGNASRDAGHKLFANSTNGDEAKVPSGYEERCNCAPCFYADFMKCQPLNFKGTEGVVGLTRWIEKLESVFNISPEGICNDLGSAQEKDDGQFVTRNREGCKGHQWTSDNILWNVKSADLDSWMRAIELANDLMDQETPHYDLQYGTGVRKPYVGSLALTVPSAIFTIMARCTSGAHKRAMGQSQRKWLSLCVEHQGILRESCPKLKNKDGGNGMHKGWV